VRKKELFKHLMFFVGAIALSQTSHAEPDNSWIQQGAGNEPKRSRSTTTDSDSEDTGQIRFQRLNVYKTNLECREDRGSQPFVVFHIENSRGVTSEFLASINNAGSMVLGSVILGKLDSRELSLAKEVCKTKRAQPVQPKFNSPDHKIYFEIGYKSRTEVTTYRGGCKPVFHWAIWNCTKGFSHETKYQKQVIRVKLGEKFGYVITESPSY
jgi:hypothetical protein